MKAVCCFACAATLAATAVGARTEHGVYFATHFGNWYARTGAIVGTKKKLDIF